MNKITGIESAVSGSQSKQINVNAVKPAEAASAEIKKDELGPSAPPKKVININESQTCKNKGCDQTFKERDNHETACSYHPGPAIFHDRVKGVCTITMLS